MKPRPGPITKPPRKGAQPQGPLQELEPDFVYDANCGQGIMVAVLDTWPMIADQTALRDTIFEAAGRLDAALKAQGVGAADRHQARARMTRASGDDLVPLDRIQNFYDQYATPGDPRCSHLTCDGEMEEPELMPDHGLFVADMIKDIAPRVDLSVYRVLNDWGVGDLRTIARALDAAIAEAKDAGNKPLVVNVSLGVGPEALMIDTLLGEHDVIDGVQTKLTGAELAVSDSKEWSKRVSQILDEGARPNPDPVEWLPGDPKDPESGQGTLNTLKAQGLVDPQAGDEITYVGVLKAIDILFHGKTLPPNVLVVAAAGNDSCRNRLSDPRIPALIEGVIGVSAAVPVGNSDRWQRATYSNADDIAAPDDGIAALGGNVNTGNGHSEEAPVGLYIADKRPGINDEGLAQWAGTSFAAPIVTAYAAAIWSAALREGNDIEAAAVIEAIVKNPDGTERRLIPLGHE